MLYLCIAGESAWRSFFVPPTGGMSCQRRLRRRLKPPLLPPKTLSFTVQNSKFCPAKPNEWRAKVPLSAPRSRCFTRQNSRRCAELSRFFTFHRASANAPLRHARSPSAKARVRIFPNFALLGKFNYAGSVWQPFGDRNGRRVFNFFCIFARTKPRHRRTGLDKKRNNKKHRHEVQVRRTGHWRGTRRV